MNLKVIAAIILIPGLAVAASAQGMGGVIGAPVHTWTNGAGTNLWDNPGNWDEGSVPDINANVEFDGTSVADCSVNLHATANTIRINVGYTGTITQMAGFTITVNGLFQVDIGTFIGGDSGISTNQMVITGGSFTSTAAMLSAGLGFQHSGGTFLHNNGTVALNGSNQSIAGSSTFFNLIKTVAIARTLIFEEGTTQVILGTLGLEGGPTGQLSLRSQVPGTQWSIDARGPVTLGYLDVQDSASLNPMSAIGTNSIDSGNNSGWIFAALPEAEQVWGDCGSVGVDLMAPLALLAILRRFRRRA